MARARWPRLGVLVELLRVGHGWCEVRRSQGWAAVGKAARGESAALFTALLQAGAIGQCMRTQGEGAWTFFGRACPVFLYEL